MDWLMFDHPLYGMLTLAALMVGFVGFVAWVSSESGDPTPMSRRVVAREGPLDHSVVGARPSGAR